MTRVSRHLYLHISYYNKRADGGSEPGNQISILREVDGGTKRLAAIVSQPKQKSNAAKQAKDVQIVRLH